MAEVEVVALDKRYKKLERNLAKVAAQVLKFLKKEKFSIEIYLVGSPKMRAINTRSRGKREPTNVLAYPAARFPETGRRSLGEIYLCPSFIRRKGEDIEALLAHGILHLLGFNHERLNDRMTMERREKEILEWLNH